jgi:hypothetical protein
MHPTESKQASHPSIPAEKHLLFFAPAFNINSQIYVSNPNLATRSQTNNIIMVAIQYNRDELKQGRRKKRVQIGGASSTRKI